MEADPDSLTFIAGPDGQLRILVPIPLYGACDVPWCLDPECLQNCALDWPLLSEYVIELEFDREKTTRRIELAAYPITTFWDPDSVSWDFPWSTPGGDIFLTREWRDKEILFPGEKKEGARFFVLDPVREVLSEGHFIYGFALTAPIPRELKESETGLLPQEVGAIGKLEAIRFRLNFDLGSALEPPPPMEVFEVIGVAHPPPPLPLSDVKDKGYSIPSGKPLGPVIKPPPPPPPPTPTQEVQAPDPPPPPPRPPQEKQAPDPPPPPPTPPTPTQEKKAPDPPPADEKDDPDPPPNDVRDLPKPKPAGD